MLLQLGELVRVGRDVAYQREVEGGALPPRGSQGQGERERDGESQRSS